MLFRAIFWIGLVSVLMPHEPDLGLGRPSASASLTSTLMEAATDGLGAGGAEVSSEGASESISSGFQSFALRSLSQIRADIEESKALRTGS